MANKAWTQQEVLDRLQELNPKPGFALVIFLPGGHSSTDYPDSLEEAAGIIERSQVINKVVVAKIIYGDFCEDCYLSKNEVRVTMT